MDKIDKLKAGIEDTVRSIKGCEDWSIEKIETQGKLSNLLQQRKLTDRFDNSPSTIHLRQLTQFSTINILLQSHFVNLTHPKYLVERRSPVLLEKQKA